MFRNRMLLKSVAVFLLLQFTFQIFLPTLSYALTSGPSQPEFSSFEPVATTNMVDEFTGDFTYNLPVLEVPGPNGSSYPLNLSYHGGVTPEEEASWVGYGWSLNPGAINRNTRGVPDDHSGVDVKFHNKAPKNWTVTVGAGIGLEAFGKDLLKSLGAQATANASLRYNNYRGFGYNYGLGVSLGKGLVSMGYNVSDGDGSFSLNLNPYAALNYSYKNVKTIYANEFRYLRKTYLDLQDDSRINNALSGNVNLIGSRYGLFSYTQTTRPNVVKAYSGKSFNVSLNFQGNVTPVPIGGTVNAFGSYAYQENVETTTVPSYGYMYSSGAEANSSTLMDYHVENEGDFNPRSVFLGVPFSDADNFIVSGEGIGGGFRLYNARAGHFGPRKVNSHVNTFNIGGEVAAGWTFGPGADLGLGTTDLDVDDWTRLTSFAARNFTSDEPVFFRFNNDLGGEWGTNHTDKPLQANYDGSKNPVLPPSVDVMNVSNARSGRSSYIGYHLNKEIVSGSTPTQEAYSRIAAVNTFANRTASDRQNLIGEMTVFNEAGSQYNYALPVYCRNEVALNYSAQGLTPVKNYIAYTSSPNETLKMGEERNGVYASTYLLTEILTPDYVDAGVSGTKGEYGSSVDDLGGYTRFNYSKTATPGGDEWYAWRVPYRGLHYNRNSQSDPLDDTGGYQGGEKEVYYLSSVETKTHVAIFTLTAREDAHEAILTDFTSDNGFGPHPLRRLSKIDLYSISDFQRDTEGDIKRETWGTPKLEGTPKPIKTVYFEYDYSQTTGVLNASTGNGKLTLKRVFFEYNGVTRAKISPYTFEYKYPAYATTYPGRYSSGNSNVTTDYAMLSEGAQNPPYSEFLSDGWGNYQSAGDDQYENGRPWLNQRKKPNVDFDPAAWHLKVIKLPSDGEIHVQYEQDDYSYVQNLEAHVMAGLKEEPLQGGSSGVYNRYVIDLTTIGLSAASTDEEFQALEDMVVKRYVQDKKKIYFKLLYKLIGIEAVDPNFFLQSCNAEYITGYASVVGASVDSDLLELHLDLAFDGTNRLPDAVCADFVKSMRLGKVDPGASCDASRGMNDPSSPEAIVNQFTSMLSGVLVPEQLCKRIDINHSYFRIPTPLPKKGGGVRVKRLMMFDKGFKVDNVYTDPVLYGSEYLYQTVENGRVISSGVATNEPASFREENILIDFVAKKGQGFWSKLVAGKDKEQAEGPIGETVLPGPSVGYSKVTIKNIHSGKSNPGFTVSEFFTARDYPIELGDPDDSNIATQIKRNDDPPVIIPTPFYSKVKNKTRATQGFSFILNNMHGQVKSKAGYAGDYNDAIRLETAVEVNRVSYEYFEPGEKIPVMSSLMGGVQLKNPGREVELTFAQRKVTEKSNDVNVEVDLQVTVIPLAFVVLVIPYPTAIPSFSMVDGEMYTHMTTKVVRYPAVVKKTNYSQEGIFHTEENLAFDEFSGRPISVRASDEYKGAFLSQSIPASWEYSEMAGKWKGQDKLVTGSFSVTSNYVSLGASNCSIADFSAGDKIRLKRSGSTTYYYVTAVDLLTNRLKVDVAPGSGFASGTYTELMIIKSGRTNQLKEMAGVITSHNENKQSAVPVAVNQANRYSTQYDLITALNNAKPASGSGTFNISGTTFSGINMTAFSNILTGCSTDLTNAEVKDLEYRYTESGETGNRVVNLELMAFWIKCNGTWMSIRAVGW